MIFSYLFYIFYADFEPFSVLDKVELKRKRLRTGNELNFLDIDGSKFSHILIFISFIIFFGDGS